MRTTSTSGNVEPTDVEPAGGRPWRRPLGWALLALAAGQVLTFAAAGLGPEGAAAGLAGALLAALAWERLCCWLRLPPRSSPAPVLASALLAVCGLAAIGLAEAAPLRAVGVVGAVGLMLLLLAVALRSALALPPVPGAAAGLGLWPRGVAAALALSSLAAAGALSTGQQLLPWPPAPAIAPAIAAGARPAERSLRLLVFNAFLEQWPFDRRRPSCRALAIGERIASRGVDVAALIESRDAVTTRALVRRLPRLGHRLLHQPPRQLWRGRLGNGGISLLSHHPLRLQHVEPFTACHGWARHWCDCFAAKGFVHAVVELDESSRFNLVVAHLDSGEHGGDVAARARQLAQLRRYLAGLPPALARWPLLLAGDLNVEGIAPGAVEHRRMIEQLSLGDRPRDIFAPAGTTPASTLNCASDALAACASGPRPRSRLDYALVYPGRGTPRLRVRGAAVVDFADRGRCGVGFLSDHKALQIDLALD